jgi:nitroreductase
MEVFVAIHERHSVGAYLPEEVPIEKMERILEASMRIK